VFPKGPPIGDFFVKKPFVIYEELIIILAVRNAIAELLKGFRINFRDKTRAVEQRAIPRGPVPCVPGLWGWCAAPRSKRDICGLPLRPTNSCLNKRKDTVAAAAASIEAGTRPPTVLLSVCSRYAVRHRYMAYALTAAILDRAPSCSDRLQ
jgi:hypothetical protein